MRRLLLLGIALFVAALAGCASLGYYGQAIGGHLDVLGRARPIDELLSDPASSTALKYRLQRVLAIREFASQSLALPNNNSYRRYADLERPYALWNVFATPELSLKAKKWCFPVVGCVSYRGYFSLPDAEREAEQLRAEGYDVHVGGVAAYSTLGWFDDPVLNTMFDRPEAEFAGTIFHELAHQKIYVRDDTAFNESFAMTIEREGVRRWLATNGAPADYASYLERNRRREEFTAVMLRTRSRLETLYGSEQSDEFKRAGKHALFVQLKDEYQLLKERWGGYAAFDGWMKNLNNAKFISIGLYRDHLPAFEVLLARHGGDLAAFYRAVAALANETKEARAQRLIALAAETVPSAASDIEFGK